MRLVPRRWKNETWVCSIRGHVVPAAGAARLRPQDVNLGVELDDGTRVSRCLRCDLWIRTDPPDEGTATFDVVPPLDEIELPRRGKPLEDAIFLRLIAIDKMIHGFLFSVAAILLVVVELKLPRIQIWAQSLFDDVSGTIDNTARGSHSLLSSQLEKVLDLDAGELRIVLAVLVAYAVSESVEAYGLWRERRWAEYLTVVATAGLLPLEIHELIDRVTVLRVLGLVVNVVIVVYLVYAKRLFGLRGGAAALEQTIDWDEILSSPISPDHTPVSADAAPAR
jgi:uncharacterized membrane protein (DUF2068 family)